MKKVILKQFGAEVGHALVENEKVQEMTEIYLSNYKGLPERWEVYVEGIHQADQIIEEKIVIDQEAIAEIPAVMNELGDIVQEAIPAIPAISHKEVLLKAEFTVEVFDLEQDYDFLLAECIKKRVAEYPKAEDFLNSYFDGGGAEIQKLREQRLAIKAKYPKPTKEQ